MSFAKLIHSGIIGASGASAQFFPQYIGNRLTGSSFGVPGRDATYDYVIIGGGTAGNVVAARLIEKTNATVAIIEAGSFSELNNGNQSQVPYYCLQYAGLDWQPLIDWGLVANGEPGTNGRRLHYAQGKALGGSSIRNQMYYNRGTKGSYDLWAQEVGDESYAWDNILPFFERSVNFTKPNMEIRAANATANYSIQATQQTSGPLHITYPNYAQPIGSYGPEAFAAAGFPPSPDVISGVLDGYGYFTFTYEPETQLRSSSESAFLSQAIRSNRLTVYQSSLARRVLFNGNRTAVGVEVELQGLSPYVVHANKEVVLSAGPMHSPQLLMLSGIGPKNTLSKYNISTVSNLPGVGQNMHDSCNIGQVSFQMSTPSQSSLLKTSELLQTAETQFISNGSGPLTNVGGDFAAWEKLPSAFRQNFSAATREALDQWPDDWPELELVLGDGPFDPDTGSGEGAGNYYGSIAILLVAATSRGNVSINSSSVHNQPVIHANRLESQADQEVAVAAYRRVLSIVQRLGARVGDFQSPNATVFASDTSLLEWIKAEGVGEIHHGSSTCRMGTVNDTMAVVDSKGRVFGVQGLRVVDSSSFRFTPPGHTQGPTYGHAEKLVQDIINTIQQGR
ncbi:alcohol oxidase [Massarina eburnea CBS 473.64]|uniref:Alcohol oxidase n=1 Tax=Massarina eburnea CBS 473.64 TaxID=1395130 RepID=A0A6A6RII5_9PLEO|nr:alcohol oxidase [Massarina eburnea CBS 473.64]